MAKEEEHFYIEEKDIGKPKVNKHSIVFYKLCSSSKMEGPFLFLLGSALCYLESMRGPPSGHKINFCLLISLHFLLLIMIFL